jgi:hypothetical protein
MDWESLGNGGAIARVSKKPEGISINQLPRVTIEGISALLNNLNNPHILGLAAREVFFLEDRIVVVEGQEDVVFIRRALRQNSHRIWTATFGDGVL